MKIGLRRLNHIATVAELRSFSRAAEALSISQPALSRSIASVEAAFGIKLFDRGRSGVFLTPAGAALAADAKRLLSQAQTLEHNLSLWSTGEGGTVAFGLGPLLASIVLPMVMADVARNHPNLTVHAAIKSRHEILDDLTTNKLEFCLFSGLLPSHDSVSIKQIGSIRIGFFCRAGHPLADQAAVSANDLRKFPICSGAMDDSYDPMQSENESYPPHLAPRIVCENYHILKEVVVGSDAVWITSHRMLDQELRSGEAVELQTPEIEMFRAPMALHCAQMLHRSLSPPARLILDRVTEILEHVDDVPTVS